MVTNLGFYFTTQKQVRAGKFVWWADTNPSLMQNQLLGGDLLNPKKGFDHFYAGQLGKYVPGGGLSKDKEGINIFRSFKPTKASSGTTITLSATGWDDAPEADMVIMVAPKLANTTGQSAKITEVVYDKEEETFTITVDTALTVAEEDILVEANGKEAASDATVLVDYVNMWILADTDLLPTEGYGVHDGHYYLSGVRGCAAFIGRMQPLPEYILAQNESKMEGVFKI